MIVSTVVAVALAAAAEPSSSGTLSAAYKREHALLEAERVSLTKRLADLETAQRARQEALRNEVSLLQARLISATARNAAVDEELARASATQSSDEETSSMLEGLLTQAADSLSRLGREKVDDKQPSPQALDRLFSLGSEAVSDGARAVAESGRFFDEEGTEKEGQIFRLGRVAAFAKAVDAKGALVPAGSGREKLMALPGGAGASAAQAIVDGEMPDLLSLWLKDGGDAAVEQKKRKTFIEYTSTGGEIAWVIVCLGVLSMLLAAGRGLVLSSWRRGTAALFDNIPQLVVRGQLAQAAELSAKARGPIARMFAVAISVANLSRADAEEEISAKYLVEAGRVDRLGNLVLLAAAVAPLLGLLGTVTGMIATFDIITEHGNSNPRLLSSGISEALITTMYGLIVAIPSLLLGNLQSGSAERIHNDMELAALSVLNAAAQHKSDDTRPSRRRTDVDKAA